MNVERTRSVDARVRVYAALADTTRLRIVDLLTVGDATSTEIGAALGVPSNLLAHHVKALEQADLVVRHRSEGDGRRSYYSLGPAAAGVTGQSILGTPSRVVFVCTANTARSHLAAALWRQGTHPGERINPGAVEAARRHDLPLPEVAPQPFDGAVREGDLVITVCDRAHEQLGGTGWAHWSVRDPAPAGTTAAFDAAYKDLAARVSALAPRLAMAS
jgi:ArsR family transcriptional regulator, arsenate/arsenite/antimonite-responsive transcriptional repressor / arsenate reductase (thioredoxin)